MSNLEKDLIKIITNQRVREIIEVLVHKDKIKTKKNKVKDNVKVLKVVKDNAKVLKIIKDSIQGTTETNRDQVEMMEIIIKDLLCHQ